MTDPSQTIPARLGIEGEWRDDELQELRLEPYPEIVRNGAVRISALALVADMMGGWVADRDSGHDWVFTTDLSVRAPVRPVPTAIIATGRDLRIGKSAVATDIHMRDENGALVAYSHAGFIRMARRYGDDPKPDFQSAAERWSSNRPPRIDRPLAEAVGIEVVDAATGAVVVVLRDELRNPAGAMQGAMVALVGEVAAEAMAEHHLGTPQIVTDLDIRYLAMGRIGPVHGRAWFIGEPHDATMHVELRDEGNGNRLMTAILARTAPAPGQ